MGNHGNASDITQELLDRRTAARMLSLGLGTLDKLIDSGELHARRVGRRVLVPRVELERFARQGAQVKKSEAT